MLPPVVHGRPKAMLRFANQEERFCEIRGETVLVEIVHSDTSHGGVGGMLDPRRVHSFEVNCPYEDECRRQGCDCMWARGVHRSQHDPLGLRLPRHIFHPIPHLH
ncbi:MAG: hypothetical protein B1H03_06300 [Planctomycetales bacterium 4484_113]|nr:MAG: hypothetical protein B1H03_06300 [Planctomycetales bacterium 4484_113]